MKYIPVMGLEIHAELSTASKVFCSCANDFGGGENTRVCPRCSGMPGTLPLINQNAYTLAARALLSTVRLIIIRRSTAKIIFIPTFRKRIKLRSLSIRFARTASLRYAAAEKYVLTVFT